MGISTHILDTSIGRPAAGVPVTLEEKRGADWLAVGSAESDPDGRVRQLVPGGRELSDGTLRLRFDVDAYLSREGRTAFFPEVEIVFRYTAGEHHHVPLLLSPYGYSTYRGS